jgi:hypothetical protein
VLAKVTVVKITNYGTLVCGDVAAVTLSHTDCIHFVIIECNSVGVS